MRKYMFNLDIAVRIIANLQCSITCTLCLFIRIYLLYSSVLVVRLTYASCNACIHTSIWFRNGPVQHFFSSSTGSSKIGSRLPVLSTSEPIFKKSLILISYQCIKTTFVLINQRVNLWLLWLQYYTKFNTISLKTN